MKITIAIAAILLVGCQENQRVKSDVLVKGKVLSHAVTADKYGRATYRTIIRCRGGGIVERTGLNFYAVPVDSTCTLTFN